MAQFNVGDTIYFLKFYDFSNKPDPNEPPIGSAKVGKVGRKYITFSEVNGRTESYYLSGLRYNIAELEIEYHWAGNEWRLLARDLFDDRSAAAIESERQLLIGALLHRRLESEVRKLPLELLLQLEHCLDLTDRERDRLDRLRQIDK